MTGSQPSESSEFQDRLLEVQRVLDSCVERRLAGEDLTDQQIVAEYARLMPELGEELSNLRVIERARRLAGEVNSTRTAGSGAPSGSPAHQSIEGYEILSEIHRGGQGVVYKAVQKATKRTVALKVMLEGPCASARQRHRFEREIDLAAGLQHPNIVTIYDSGVTADGSHYFVMAYIRGHSLSEYVSKNKPSIDQTLLLFQKICAAVNYAHQRGVIHRDLKPSNIRIDAGGEPHLLDFGLARAAGMGMSEGAPVTVTGEFMGTLAYASPEQMRGDTNQIDIRTDVYSLGVILYEMLTGKYPYPVIGQMADVLRNIAEAEPKRPSTIQRRINDEIETIVLKALAKEKERRYQSADTLARDIEHYLNGEAIEAKRDSGLYVLRKALRRYKRSAAAAAVFVTLLAAFGIVMFIQAERNRRLANDNLELASVEQAATREAVKARDEARWQNYVANLYAADASLRVNKTAEAKRRLEMCPPELRGWEWRHLKLRSDCSMVVLEDNTYKFVQVAYTPDGRQLVALGDKKGSRSEHVAVRWDVATYRSETKSLNLPQVTGPPILASGGAQAAYYRYGPFGWGGRGVESPNVLIVVDTRTGERTVLRGAENPPLNWAEAAYSPDGSRLVSALDGPQLAEDTLRVWDTASGQLRTTVDAYPGRDTSKAVGSLAVTSDGRHIAIRTDSFGIIVRDAATGEILSATTDQSTGRYASIWFSGDGRSVVWPSDDDGVSIRLWPFASDAPETVFRGHTGRVYCVAFSHDGDRMASGADDNTVRIWDLADGELLRTLRGHDDAVVSVTFSPDGATVASADAAGVVRVWDAAYTDGVRRLYSSPARTVAFSADGASFVYGSVFREAAIVWNTEYGVQLFALRGHQYRVPRVDWSPDGARIVSVTDRGSSVKPIRIWDAVTGEQLLALPGNMGFSASVAFSPGGRRLASLDEVGTLTLWDLVSGQAIWSVPHEDQTKAWAVGVAFDPVGNRVATSGDLLIIRDAATGEQIMATEGHRSTGRRSTVSFSSDGSRLLTGDTVWSAATLTPIGTLEGHSGIVTAARFTSDDTRIVTGSLDGTVRVWDAESLDLLLTLRDAGDQVYSVATSPDGTRILCAANRGMWMWETTAPARHFAARSAAADARRRARQIVDPLLDELVVTQDVVERLEADATISEAVRAEALRWIALRAGGPSSMNARSWRIVIEPGGNVESYRRALRGAEAACRLRPDKGNYLETLGVAQYRLGEYEDAFATLRRSAEMWPTNRISVRPFDRAFLAMALHQLGREDEALAALERARTLMQSRWKNDEEFQSSLREAEALFVARN